MMKRIWTAVLGCTLALAWVETAGADPFYWTGVEDNAFENANNWDPGLPPNTGSPGAMIFNTGLQTTVVDSIGAVDRRYVRMEFSNFDYTISTSRDFLLALGTGGMYVDGVNVAVNAARNFQINITAYTSTGSFSATNGGSLTLTTGTGTFSAGGSNTRYLHFDGDGDITLNGAMTTGVSPGHGAGLRIRSTFSGLLVLNTAGSTFFPGTGNAAVVHQGTGTVAFGANDAIGTLDVRFENDAAKVQAGGAARTLANNLSVESNFSVTGMHALGFSGGVDFGTAARTVTVTEAEGRLVLSGAVSGSDATMTKAGAGVLELTGDNAAAWSQGVQVTGGGLVVGNGSGSATGSGALHVADGAYVQGTGRIGGAATVAGQVRLVEETALRFAGGLTLSEGSSVFLGDGSAAGRIDGDLALGSDVTVLLDGDGVWVENETYRIFDLTDGQVTGTFSLGGPYAGFFTYQSGEDGFVDLTIIPEPGTAALLLGASILLLARRRRPQSSR